MLAISRAELLFAVPFGSEPLGSELGTVEGFD